MQTTPPVIPGRLKSTDELAAVWDALEAGGRRFSSRPCLFPSSGT